MILNGNETEKEFFEKSLEHWELVLDLGVSDQIKLIKIATIFHEMRHRLEELQ